MTRTIVIGMLIGLGVFAAVGILTSILLIIVSIIALMKGMFLHSIIISGVGWMTVSMASSIMDFIDKVIKQYKF